MPVALAFGVADVVAAFAVLLVVWACSVLLVRPLTWLLSSLPVIGSEVADRLSRGMDAVVNWAADWAKGAVGAMVAIISVPVTWVGQVIANVVGFAGDVVGNLLSLVGKAATLAAEVVHNAAYATGQLIALGAKLVALAASVPGIAADVARSLIATAEKVLRTAIAAVSAALAAAVAAEQALIARVKGDLLSLIAGQVGVVVSAMAALAQTLRAEWATDLKPIEAELGHIGQVLAPVLALDLALVIPRILTDIQTMRRDCVDPLCGVLSPILGTISAVGDVATLALVGGVVGEAIANPAATAHATAGLADDIHGLAADLFGLFTGARA